MRVASVLALVLFVSISSARADDPMPVEDPPPADEPATITDGIGRAHV